MVIPPTGVGGAWDICSLNLPSLGTSFQFAGFILVCMQGLTSYCMQMCKLQGLFSLSLSHFNYSAVLCITIQDEPHCVQWDVTARIMFIGLQSLKIYSPSGCIGGSKKESFHSNRGSLATSPPKWSSIHIFEGKHFELVLTC